ncbi:MAG: PAS domain S-box protein, partial [bacterium]
MAEAQILIVEDERIVAKDIQNRLSHLGYGIAGVAASGKGALKKARETNPDLVLMDILLREEMDGIEAARQIRDRLHIPVIFLTAYADDKTLERAKVAEPYGYIIKPFEEKELRTAIEMALYKHKMEKELRRSEERFRAIFETAQDSIFIKDCSLRYTEVNPAMERLFELPAEELIGKTDEDLFGKEAASHIRQDDLRVLKGDILNIEHRKPVGGVPKTFHVVKTPLRDSRGEIIGLCGIARDITQRVQADEALRESEEKFRTIFEKVTDMITYVDKHGKILDVNKRVEDFLGYKRDEVIGKNFTEVGVLGPKDLPGIAKLFRDTIRAGKPVSMVELELRHKNGNKVFLEVGTRFIKKNGRVEGVVNIFRDITERKQAEERIRRQSAVLDAINRVFRETLTCETDEEVARTCLAVAEELTGSKFGFIGEVNEAGRFDTIALSDPGWDACRIPKLNAVAMIKDMEIRGVWGRVLKDEKSLIVNDPTSHPDSVGTPEGHPKITAFLGVPLKYRGRTIGMIGLANKETGYDPADQEAVESLSVAFVEALMRKRAEEALRESEEKYRHIAKNPVDGVAMAQDGRIIYVNDAYCKIFGYKREELIGESLLEVVAPEDRSLIEERAKKRFKDIKVPNHYVFRGMKKDGTKLFIEVSSSKAFVYKNKSTILAILRDITERKRAEEALQESEEKYRTLVEHANDAIYLVEGKRFSFVNSRFEEILGYSAQEVCAEGFDLMRTVAPESRGLIARRAEARRRGEELPSRYTFKALTKGGEVRDVEVNTVSLGDTSGVKVLGILRDITEQVRMEEALREAQQRFEMAIEETPMVAVQGLDRTGKILHWNRAAELIYGFSKSEAKDKLLQDLLLEGEEAHRFVSTLEDIWRSGKATPPREWTVKTKSEEVRTVFSTMFPVFSKGECVEVFCMDVDITEREQLKSQLLQSE